MNFDDVSFGRLYSRLIPSYCAASANVAQWVQPVRFTPRHTYRCFYLSSGLFSTPSKTNVLDVGCITDNPTSGDKVSGLVGESPYAQVFRQHHEVYAEYGCQVEAIDIRGDDIRTQRGDARCLAFGNNSFHLVVCGMLIGRGNPCANPVDIWLCLREFSRVLVAGGVVYLADDIVDMTTVLIANLLGFDVYLLRGWPSPLPVGVAMLLRHCECRQMMKLRKVIVGTCAPRQIRGAVSVFPLLRGAAVEEMVLLRRFRPTTTQVV